MSEHELDATDRKVRATIYGMVAEAHGHVPGYDKPYELAEFCTCGHHGDEHHGPFGTLHCSECGCQAFVTLTGPCPDCGGPFDAGDERCGRCGVYAEELAARIRRDRDTPKSQSTASGDDSAGEPDHNRRA